MTKPRKVCVVTGSRAEYGLLRPLLAAIQSDAALQLQVVVSGMHLSSKFGNTWRDVVTDGYQIDERVEMPLASDTEHAINIAMGQGQIGFSTAWKRLQPDIVLVLGDRFEIMAAVTAAMLHRIPIAHVHGGEASEGQIDEAIRHSITKMAQLHFTAAEPYRQRVIQLGEDPAHVHNVGALAADNIASLPLLDKTALEDAINFPLDDPLFLVTYHPVTLSEAETESGIEALLQALDRFPEARIIFTQANADTGGCLVNQRIDAYVARNSDRCTTHKALGAVRYLSAMRMATAVIGNSSSGIIEAPIMGVPTVNIGDRQRGRLRAASILDCAEDTDAIVVAIEQCRISEFRQRIAAMDSPYGDGHAADRICRILRETELDGLIHKRFHDINCREVK